VSVARQKLTSEFIIKPLTGQPSAAAASTWNMSSLQHSLSSGVNSTDFCPGIDVAEAKVAESTLATGGENIVVCSDSEGWKIGTVSSSSVSTSASSLVEGHETPSHYSFTAESLPESRIPRDMASEITALLDQLESNVLSTYDELKRMSCSEGALRIILEGFFFSQLWTEDILTFYRCALSIQSL